MIIWYMYNLDDEGDVDRNRKTAGSIAGPIPRHVLQTGTQTWLLVHLVHDQPPNVRNKLVRISGIAMLVST